MESNEKYDSEIWLKISQLPYMVAIGMEGAGRSGLLGSIMERQSSLESLLSARTDFPGNPIISKLISQKEDHDTAMQMVTDNHDAALNYLHALGITSHEDLWKQIEDCVAEVIPAIQKREAGHTLSDYVAWLKHIANQVAIAAKEGDTLGLGGERFSSVEQRYFNRLERVLQSVNP